MADESMNMVTRLLGSFISDAMQSPDCSYSPDSATPLEVPNKENEESGIKYDHCFHPKRQVEELKTLSIQHRSLFKFIFQSSELPLCLQDAFINEPCLNNCMCPLGIVFSNLPSLNGGR